MLLNAHAVKAANPESKPYKLRDGGGLHCLVKPGGSKLWQYRYEIGGREKLLSIGSYPEVSLAAARTRRDEARQVVKAGGDPSAEKKAARAAKAERQVDDAGTFGFFAQRRLDKALAQFEPQTCKKWKLHMGYAIGKFGKRPIGEITRAEVIEYLETFERLGQVSTMHSIKIKMAQAFEDAMDAGVITANPAAIRAGRLEPVRHKGRAAITDPVRFGQLLRAIDTWQGQPATIGCLKISALCFQRPAEIRKARWSEIDWDHAMWEIPAERMKKVAGERRAHLVPLSKQAIQVLRDMQALYGTGDLIFPALGKADRPLSENTVNVALRGMGFTGEEMTGHGFRAAANTILKERVPFPAWIIDRNDVIQRQLAHIEANETIRAYDRAVLLKERKWMMQAWADFCDSMRRGGQVVPIGGAVEREA